MYLVCPLSVINQPELSKSWNGRCGPYVAVADTAAALPAYFASLSHSLTPRIRRINKHNITTKGIIINNTLYNHNIGLKLREFLYRDIQNYYLRGLKL